MNNEKKQFSGTEITITMFTLLSISLSLPKAKILLCIPPKRCFEHIQIHVTTPVFLFFGGTEQQQPKCLP